MIILDKLFHLELKQVYFKKIGISTVVCGPGSIDQAHKIDEFIVLDELKKCLNLLHGIKTNSVTN